MISWQFLLFFTCWLRSRVHDTGHTAIIVANSRCPCRVRVLLSSLPCRWMYCRIGAGHRNTRPPRPSTCIRRFNLHAHGSMGPACNRTMQAMEGVNKLIYKPAPIMTAHLCINFPMLIWSHAKYLYLLTDKLNFTVCFACMLERWLFACIGWQSRSIVRCCDGIWPCCRAHLTNQIRDSHIYMKICTLIACMYSFHILCYY